MRSLYIPNIADHPHGANIDPRDLALQVVDIVTLRPEIELCYMGIGTKCFEILENKPTSTIAPSPFDYQAGDSYNTDGATGNAGYTPLEGDVTDEEELDGDDMEEEDVEDAVESEDDLDNDAEWDEGDDDDDDDFEEVGGGKGRIRLRLREILFYDDKVAVFKARHGRL